MTLADRPTQGISWSTALQPDMLQSLGNLAVISAQIEEVLHKIYWKHASLTEQNGPVVTDNLNPKRLTEDILKFVALDGAKAHILADLQILVAEFNTLNTKRNRCLHWIWEAKYAEKLVGILYQTDEPQAYQVKRPIYRQSGIHSEDFTAADMAEICNDFGWLLRRLDSHTFEEGALRAMRESTDRFGTTVNSDGSVNLSGLADLFYPAPWLDKQLQQGPTPPSPPDTQK